MPQTNTEQALREYEMGKRFGLEPLSDTQALNYYKSLKVLLTIEGKDCTKELNELYQTMYRFHIPESICKQIESFDVKNQKVETYLIKLDHVSTQRMLVYDAIRIAGSDGKYEASERASVNHGAKLLGLEPQAVEVIEEIVKLEWKTRRMKHQLFQES